MNFDEEENRYQVQAMTDHTDVTNSYAVNQQEEAWKKVMEMPLKSINTEKFALYLNQNNGEVLNYLAPYLNFNRYELANVKNYRYGGGRPHEKFVDYLLRQDIKIDKVIKAASEIGNEAVKDILTEIKGRSQGRKEMMNEIDVCEALKLYSHLYHDVANPADTPTSWRMLAGELCPEVIPDIKTVLAAGGVFNGGDQFVATLGQQGKNVGFLIEVLEKNHGPDAPSLIEVANVYKEAVKKRASQLIEKENEKHLKSLR